MKSKFMTLDLNDLLHGIVIAVLTAIIAGVLDMLQKGAVFDWVSIKPVLIAAISAALSYLLKCLSTNSQNQMFTREPGMQGLREGGTERLRD
jgi:hypothetical protein